MCGICGTTWRDEELIRRMADSLTHRGPDQSGIFCDDGISLGHRRLSIIDLSERGQQPIGNEDASLQLVFNGEIYNFRELRPQLERMGHVFRSDTDSEVILHGYEAYGAQVVDHLRGMFAFALWDRKRRTLFAARDRMGIKPFYYHRLADGRLAFGSEIKALLECPDIPRRLNRQALYDYLGFEFVSAPETMFEGIFKLPAGHCLTYHEGDLSLHPYWDLTMGGDSPPPYAEAVERQRELLDETVKSHLVSDVPLGVFLSGGLDSSALVAMMRRHIPGRLRTFTIGYRDKTFSELDYAQQVADVFATDHHVLMIDDLRAEHVEKALWHLDEPMTDLSTVPLMLVCEQARRHVKVCLSGEGGDESYAGYDRFKAAAIDRFYRLIPGLLRRGLVEPLVAALPDRPQKKGAVNMLKRFIEGAALPAEGEHLRWQYFSNANRETDLFSPGFRAAVTPDPFRLIRAAALRCAGADRVNRQAYLDMRAMMPDSVLMKVDKMSMAHALEIRVPLLDHVLVEFIASLPGNWKLKGLRTKHVLRSALNGILPHNIVERGKQGYSLPVKHLLRTELKDYMIALLSESPLVRETTRRETVQRLIEEHTTLRHNHNHMLWALMNAAIWQRRFNVAV